MYLYIGHKKPSSYFISHSIIALEILSVNFFTSKLHISLDYCNTVSQPVSVKVQKVFTFCKELLRVLYYMMLVEVFSATFRCMQYGKQEYLSSTDIYNRNIPEISQLTVFECIVVSRTRGRLCNVATCGSLQGRGSSSHAASPLPREQRDLKSLNNTQMYLGRLRCQFTRQFLS